MDSLALVGLIFAVIAFIFGAASLILSIGMMRSTHQVVWKEAKPLEPEKDPFLDEEEIIDLVNNPNKRQAPKPEGLKPFSYVTGDALNVEETEPFLDLDDPNETSNEW